MLKTEIDLFVRLRLAQDKENMCDVLSQELVLKTWTDQK